MAKRFTLLMLIIGVVVSLGCAVLQFEEPQIEAKFVKVSRRNVHQVKAITGRLTYDDEHYAFATSAGTVDRIYVEPGDRISSGQAMLRLLSDAPTEMNTEVLSGSFGGTDGKVEYSGSLSDAVRCERDATVRQLLVEEDSLVVPGTPLLRLSSQEQRITCAVAEADANDILAGQWAWISSSNELLGVAEVINVGTVEINLTTGMPECIVQLRPEEHVDLPEGAAVDAEIFLAGSDNVLSLPVESITDRGTVWWIHEGRCTEIDAQVVLSDEMYAWVNLPEGLVVALGEFQEGQKVVEAQE